MNEHATVTRSIIVERFIPQPAEKIWRALTEAPLIEQWLMKNDFTPHVGGRFTFQAKPMGDWDGIVNCEVTTFEPPRRLVYSWKGGSTTNPGYGSALDSIVQWNLTPESGGTHVRMEHSGFGPQNASACDAMSGGWRQVVERLEQVVAGLD